MKNVFVLSALLVGMAAQASTQVDVKAVNAVVESLIKETIKEDDVVKGISLKLDEKNTVIDYQNLKLGAELKGAVKKTPWDSSDVSSIAVDFKAKAVDAGQTDARAEIGLGATAHTNTYKLVGYISGKMLADATDPSNDTPEEKRIREILTDLQNTTSMKQVQGAIVEIRDLIVKQGKEPELDKKLTVLSGVDSSGNVESVTFRYADKEEIGFFGIKNLSAQLVVKQSSLSLSFTCETMYPDSLKDTVEDIRDSLVHLQNRSAKEVNQVKELLSDFNDTLHSLAEGKF